MVIFRENTEDIYAGIEFQHDTEENKKFKEVFQEAFPKEFAKIRFPETSALDSNPSLWKGQNAWSAPRSMGVAEQTQES